MWKFARRIDGRRSKMNHFLVIFVTYLLTNFVPTTRSLLNVRDAKLFDHQFKTLEDYRRYIESVRRLYGKQTRGS